MQRSRSLPLAATLFVLGLVASSCSLGEGQGSVSGELDIPDCWSGKFELSPDFFAAVPYRSSLQLRIQNGGDFQSFSDGISVLVNDVNVIRGAGGQKGFLGDPLPVSLPPEVTPPGVPVQPVADPAKVSLALYLQRSCPTQNVALYAMDSVTLDANGGCLGSDAGAAAPTAGGCGTDAGSLPPARLGRSTITFLHVYNNVPAETDASERLNEGSFDVYLADPREVCPGGLGPPPRCRGHLTGKFKFFFERGRPAQPFP